MLVGVLPSLAVMADTPAVPQVQAIEPEASAVTPESSEAIKGNMHHGDKMIITTAHKLFPNTTIATPSFNISKDDLDKTSATGSEDIVKMAPSVHIRRRFYADQNGVVAIRGSTNFQTNHFNMYADGIPLHNPVQFKWDGSPKWNLVAPNTLESATVFYGPYSAEHRGSFGGTFDLKTRLPEKFEMSLDATGIIQSSHRFGQDQTLTGHKEFVSAGNKIGDWSFYGFYNHLENEGQAQSFSAIANPKADTGMPAAFGSSVTSNPLDGTTIITGDLGINKNTSDLYEVKVGYDINPDLRVLATVAFEDTLRESQANSYMKDSAGNTLWGGTVSEHGYQFDVNPLQFGRPTLNGSENEKKTMMYGLNLSGKLTENWDIDTTASFFDAFKDQLQQAKFSRNDPAFQGDRSGNITDTDVWWADYSVKLATQKFLGRDDMGFMVGYQYNYSHLDINKYSAADTYTGVKGTLKQSDGGDTQMHSLFAQVDWDFIENWNFLVGGRYDMWSATNGHVKSEDVADRDANRFSPKTSLSFTPTDQLSFRYSFSKAYRFAVAQELFDSSSTSNTQNFSDPNLEAESGYFQDFKVQYDLDRGYVSASVFYNQITNEIMSTQTLLDNGNIANRTRGIGLTETVGVEVVYQQNRIMDWPISLNMNATWLDKTIKEDSNPELVGKQWVRVPHWRANGTLTYHTTDNWDNIVALQYRSSQYANDDNSDTNHEGYGSSSDYVLLNLKSSYKHELGNGMTARVSAGIDNLLDQDYYDFHPYPQRTYFVNVGLDI